VYYSSKDPAYAVLISPLSSPLLFRPLDRVVSAASHLLARLPYPLLSIQVKSIVLMAMRRIRDEELFSNYNFIGRCTPTPSATATSRTTSAL
jgi:hypothetical protein